jgi:hypothetical protein
MQLYSDARWARSLSLDRGTCESHCARVVGRLDVPCVCVAVALLSSVLRSMSPLALCSLCDVRVWSALCGCVRPCTVSRCIWCAE